MSFVEDKNKNKIFDDGSCTCICMYVVCKAVCSLTAYYSFLCSFESCIHFKQMSAKDTQLVSFASTQDFSNS